MLSLVKHLWVELRPSDTMECNLTLEVMSQKMWLRAGQWLRETSLVEKYDDNDDNGDNDDDNPALFLHSKRYVQG